jgi:hypothetical protein
VFIGRIKPHDWDAVEAGLVALLEAAEAGVVELVRTVLGQIVPEYREARPPPARTTSPHGEPALRGEPARGRGAEVRGAEGAEEGTGGARPGPIPDAVN